MSVTGRCALALALLVRHLVVGETYNLHLADQVRRELFLYFEEAVLHRLDLPIQQLLLELSPFPTFGPELARMVSGNSRAGELLGRLQRETTAMIQDRLDTYHFWPIFRRFLQWEMEQTYSEEQRRALYARAALYFELNEDYRQALEYYAKSGDQDKISELLTKNAELHPGMGHYEEMAPYYRALPEKQVLTSPALMQGMSMLEAIAMDYQRSEFWHGKLKEYADNRSRADGGSQKPAGLVGYRPGARRMTCSTPPCAFRWSRPWAGTGCVWRTAPLPRANLKRGRTSRTASSS